MDRTEILKDLQGTVCRACSNKKQSKRSFCLKCYRSLPPEMQKALYKKIFEGYEEAFENALSYLKQVLSAN